MRRLRLSKILHGISTRAILFILSYISIPLLINIMGLIKYSEFLYVAGILSIINVFEFGNSNNLVELGARTQTVKDRLNLVSLYLKKAQFLASLAFFVTCILIVLDTLVQLNPKGIQLNWDTRFSFIAGVAGVGLNFAANVYIKVGIAGKDFKAIMNVTVFASMIATFSVILAAHIQSSIWVCILLQFSLQPIIVILTLRRKYAREVYIQINNALPMTSDSVVTPHSIFKFYSLFTPIYFNLIILLFSRQADHNLFAAVTTFYRVTSIPLIFASFVWLNHLWVEIGHWKRINLPNQIRLKLTFKFTKSCSIALPFFALTSLFGTQILSTWTNDGISLDQSTVQQLSLLGLIQFIGIVPGAAMVVYRQTSFIILTHSFFLISIIINFKVFQLDERPSQIIPFLIFSELLTILIPNILWLSLKLSPKRKQIVSDE